MKVRMQGWRSGSVQDLLYWYCGAGTTAAAQGCRLEVAGVGLVTHDNYAASAE